MLSSDIGDITKSNYATSSSPKDFSVYGYTRSPRIRGGAMGVKLHDAGKNYFLGDFTFDNILQSNPIQEYSLSHKDTSNDEDDDLPLLRVFTIVFKSNHGNPDFTCLYRFMILGATDDNM